jgi:acid stress chaperone HdeB
MYAYRILIFMFFTAFAMSTAHAQVTIDASKITCDQFVHSKVGNPRVVAAWMSGFYNAKKDNTLIDLKGFEANLNKMEKFCYDEKNFSLPLMQAVEQVLGAKK